MARKAHPTFILHLHLQEHKIFQQIIADRGGGSTKEKGDRGRGGGQGEEIGEKRGEGNNLEL